LDVLTLANTIKKTSLEHAATWKSLILDNEVWYSHEAGSFKINFNIVIRDNFLAQAIMCMDSNGHIIKAISQISPYCDPIFGEALAARLTVSLAISLKAQEIFY
jgi:hypothetical protein